MQDRIIAAEAAQAQDAFSCEQQDDWETQDDADEEGSFASGKFWLGLERLRFFHRTILMMIKKPLSARTTALEKSDSGITSIVWCVLPTNPSLVQQDDQTPNR